MTLTAPCAISNSSSKPFSNLFGRIAYDNLNRVMASENTWNFYNRPKGNNLSINKYPQYQIKNIDNIIKSTILGKKYYS